MYKLNKMKFSYGNKNWPELGDILDWLEEDMGVAELISSLMLEAMSGCTKINFFGSRALAIELTPTGNKGEEGIMELSLFTKELMELVEENHNEIELAYRGVAKRYVYLYKSDAVIMPHNGDIKDKWKQLSGASEQASNFKEAASFMLGIDKKEKMNQKENFCQIEQFCEMYSKFYKCHMDWDKENFSVSFEVESMRDDTVIEVDISAMYGLNIVRLEMVMFNGTKESLRKSEDIYPALSSTIWNSFFVDLDYLVERS